MRALVDAVAGACGIAPDELDGRLVSADRAVIGAVDLGEHVAREIAVGRVFRTAAELAAAGAGLQVLVLTGPRGAAGDLWVVDGWGLLRDDGTDLDLRGARLRGAQLTGARLRGADLTDADLRGADLEKADLTTAVLTGADLAGSTLYRASLRAADLTEAELCRADLRHSDLREIVCARTAFRGADLWESYLWDVDLDAAFTEGVDLTRAAVDVSRAG